MKKILFFLSWLFVAQLNAQIVVVRDGSNSEIIKDAIVSSNGLRTSSNQKGEVNLSAFKDGTISVFSAGYSLCVIQVSEIQNAEILMYPKTIQLDEVVLAPTRHQDASINQPYSTEVLEQKRIEFSQMSNTADLLQNTGNVFVQKSQLGGGSPVLRGFEASRVLLVVDGIRMNNAIYRAGHLQDIITLDPNMLERTEILFGPSSTLYGSDALGGVVHLYTKSPSFGSKDTMNVKGNVFIRYGSANKEQSAHLDFNLGWKNVAAITNISYGSFGDLMSGRTRLQNTPTNWRRDYSAQRINERDSMVKNNDPNLQVGSAYTQMDFMEKVMIRSGAHSFHQVNFQMSKSSDVPRYDRLTEYSGANLKFAEWNYGPQNRQLAAYSFQHDAKTAISDHLKITLADQEITQQRISRNFRSSIRKIQTEKVSVQSLNADLQKRLNEKHILNYGLEAQLNSVNSSATKVNISSNAESAADTRYADGGSKMNLYGLYAAHHWQVDKHFSISDGLRFSATQLNSKFVDTTFYNLPFKSAKQNNTAITGNLGFCWQEEDNYKLSFLTNTGFRSPNVDDMTKVFESNNSILIVPNANIKPEYATNFEISLQKMVTNKVKLGFDAYYTVLQNAMVLDDFTFNGKDSVTYSGNKMKVQAMQNKDRAYIYGFNANIEMAFTSELSFKGSVNYTYGRYENVKAATVVPLDHIPPVFGQSSLFYKKKRFEAEFFVRYNGAKRSSEYSSSGEDNAQYSADPVKGYMPAWFTVNARVGLDLYKGLKLAFSCENITDIKYRVFASGINAAGRNFLITLRYKI